MPRLKTAMTIAVLVPVLVFCGYSIPSYFSLLAHQPSRDAIHPTSFPPSYALYVGAYFAVLTFVGICVIFLLIRAILWMRRPRKAV
jgi:hypothetical protein